MYDTAMYMNVKHLIYVQKLKDNTKKGEVLVVIEKFHAHPSCVIAKGLSMWESQNGKRGLCMYV